MRSLVVATALLFGSLGAHASIVTIDFNEFDAAPPAGTQDFGGVYVSNTNLQHAGFEWGTAAGGYFIMSSGGPAPTEDGAGLSVTGDPNTPGYMSVTGPGKTFSIFSFDAWHTYDALVTGVYAGGGTISVQLQDIYDGDKFAFGSEWSGLKSIEFSNMILWDADFTAGFSNPLIIDDVVVSIVPIPAAVWLFGSALAGLGFLRRQQAA